MTAFQAGIDPEALTALAEACSQLGLSVERALDEKTRELRLRHVLRCIPNARLKPARLVEFLIEVLGHPPSDGLVESVRLHDRGPAIDGRQRLELEVRQNARCATCGRWLDRDARPHVDHIVPVALGGRSELSNYQLLCAECNLGKGTAIEWLMAQPFFIVPGPAITARLRYCVLAAKRSRCDEAGCEAEPRITSFAVVPITSYARGGRLVFDNLRVVCDDHRTALEQASHARFRQGTLAAKYKIPQPR